MIKAKVHAICQSFYFFNHGKLRSLLSVGCNFLVSIVLRCANLREILILSFFLG